MLRHDLDVQLQPTEPTGENRHPARWLGPFLLAVGVLFVGLALYMRATAQVPPVAKTMIAVPAPSYRAAGQNRHQGDAAPDATWHAEMQRAMLKLRPLAEPLPSPQPGDWLAEHPEHGESFAEYLAQPPHRPSTARGVLYVQPLGLFSDAQRRIIRLAAEYLALYLHLPVRILPDLPTQVIPVSAVRRHPRTHELQLHTGTLLQRVLVPRMREDAAAYLAFTAIDLFPHPRWNFVFGQASFTAPVGVWSLARFGDPSRNDDSFRRALVRTLKTATHEAGHMFAMHHCTAYRCNMNGANSLAEADRTPIDLCPECLAKVLWLTGVSPAEWLAQLLAFFDRHHLKEEAARLRIRHAAAPPALAG